MPLSSEERYYIKLKASYLYYKENKTQAEIAELFHISRPTLIKLLNDARKEGIVTIEIHDIRMGSQYIELEQELCKKLGLKDVKIVGVGSASQEAVNSSIGEAAAAYFVNALSSGMTIGIGWGNTLQTMANFMRPDLSVKGLDIIPLLGGLRSTGSDSYTMFANSLCETVASRFQDASVSMLYTPLIAQDRKIAKTLLASEDVTSIFNKMKHLDIAIVGIDGDPAHSTTVKLEKNLQSIYYELQQKQYVGNICSRFYNLKGELATLSLEENIIAVSPENLRNTPTVIGAAGGEYKVPSIIGAARAKLFNILITDEYTAKKLVEYPAE